MRKHGLSRGERAEIARAAASLSSRLRWLLRRGIRMITSHCAQQTREANVCVARARLLATSLRQRSRRIGDFERTSRRFRVRRSALLCERILSAFVVDSKQMPESSGASQPEV